MTNDELLRYSRQIMLKDFGVEKQQLLGQSTVLIIGIGGLGSITSMYLAASGVGHIMLADFDKVELSNLQRQIIYNTDDLGKSKVLSAQQKINKLNPLIEVSVIKDIETNLDYFVNKASIVLDGTDNFASRFIINKSCITNCTPLVSAAVIKLEGQVATFTGYNKNGACYECLYKKNTIESNNCVENGILAPMAGLIGSIQALESIKILTNIENNLINCLLIIDGLKYNTRLVGVNKDEHCQTCGQI